MNEEVPIPQNPIPIAEQPVQDSSSFSPNENPKQKKGFLKALGLLEVGIIEVLFVGIVIILLFGTLNYFNILRLSETLPNQLGFLPHRQQSNNLTMKQFNNVNVTIAPVSPTDQGSLTFQAKQTLLAFLPTILTPSLLPKSPSDITLTEDRDDKEKLAASWNIKGGGAAWVVFPKPLDSQKITSIAAYFEKIQTASPSVELAKSTINQVFPTEPKGEWECKNTLNERTLYCESFWEEKDAKKGLGFLIINTSPFRGRLVFSFCERTKESNLYAWKSCQFEFAKTGVQ